MDSIIQFALIAIQAGISSFGMFYSVWSFKTGKKHIAFDLSESIHTSAAIGVSLAHLSWTFYNLDPSNIANGEMFKALAMKMAALSAGVCFREVNKFVINAMQNPVDDEKEKTSELKNVLSEAIESKISSFEEKVVITSGRLDSLNYSVNNLKTEVSRELDSLPENIKLKIGGVIDNAIGPIEKSVSNKISSFEEKVNITSGKLESINTTLKGVNGTIESVENNVSNSLRQTRESISNDLNGLPQQVSSTVSKAKASIEKELNSIPNEISYKVGMTIDSKLRNLEDEIVSATSSIKEDVSLIRQEMKRDLDDTASSFSSKIAANTNSIISEASKQGGEVILAVANKTAQSLTTVTNNALAASIKLEKNSDKLSLIAEKLQSSTN